MTAPTPPTPDLTRLIRDAEDETRRTLHEAAARRPAADGRGSGRWTGGASAIAVVLAVLVWAHFLVGGVISNDRITQDLRQLLDQAQGQVEQHLQRHGELPPVLPDATLATVVRYEIEDATAVPPRYALTAQIRGVTVRSGGTR